MKASTITKTILNYLIIEQGLHVNHILFPRFDGRYSPSVPRPNVPVLAAEAALTAAGGVGGLVVGAGSGAALGAEPERRPRGVPHAPLLHRAPCPMSSRAERDID